jgi:DNA-binding transcriptional LysR family regulator
MDLLDGIRVFVAAVETGSFAGAARRLGLSNKLVSKYVGQLEDRLGAQLLQRTTRRLGMTAAGERLMARAPDWLDEFDDMAADLREDRRRLTGTLRISAPLTFGEMHVQPLLLRFHRKHPDLTLDLRLSDSFVDLAAEGVDLAIRIGRLADSALIARRLGAAELVLVAARAHLDRHGTPETAEDLARHPCIRDTNMRDAGGWSLTQDGRTFQAQVDGRFLVNSARAARDLAIGGEGIAFCPDYVVCSDLSEGRLIRVLPSARAPALDIHAVHLRTRQVARRTRTFLDFLAADRFGGAIVHPAPP